MSAPDDSLVTGLSECCYNLLKGNLRTTPKKLQQLNRYKKQLRKMANMRVATKTKRKMIIQQGGFIGPLLSVLAPVISSIVAAVAR